MKPLHVRVLAACLLVFFSLFRAGNATEIGDFDLEQYEGKVVIVDFWASWCVPCRRSFPWLNEMHDKYSGDGLVIVGVNVDTTREEAEEFLDDYPAKFDIYYDDTKDMARDFDIMGMPSSYVFGRDGQQVARHIGFKVRRQATYEAIVVEALGVQE